MLKRWDFPSEHVVSHKELHLLPAHKKTPKLLFALQKKFSVIGYTWKTNDPDLYTCEVELPKMLPNFSEIW